MRLHLQLVEELFGIDLSLADLVDLLEERVCDESHGAASGRWLRGSDREMRTYSHRDGFGQRGTRESPQN